MPAGFHPTDDSQAVERLGHAVTVVTTDQRNIKITTPADLALAGAILKGISRRAKGPAPRGPFEEAQW
ncbi:MAG: 2-C-methyl-D-erythritol 4-phosphate cytidylyltransferase [Planctomycetes bacterium]|nr:2-C-methyl-D-erythritol 4-phosphate cytidylyltransferase [Planctomycetota bacterium]